MHPIASAVQDGILLCHLNFRFTTSTPPLSLPLLDTTAKA